MAISPRLELFRVHNDPASIFAVAHTISLSFSQDPLIRWLRPTAAPWSKSEAETCKWQYRRVQRAILDGLVFQSAPASQLAQTFSPKDDRLKHPEVVGPISVEDAEDAGTVVLLHPPKNHQKWTLKRAYLMAKMWLLDWLNPVLDGANESRVAILYTAHDNSIAEVKARYQIKDLWYLEVLGVHPSLQARGLGGKTINWILDYIRHAPIVLECTAENNVAFYGNLGFRTVEEIELKDDSESVKCWVMLRQPEWEGKST